MAAIVIACGRGSAAGNAGASATSGGSGVLAAGPTLSVGQTTRTLDRDGRTRSYIVYVPASADRGKPVAIVFVFHGGTGNADSAIHMTGFNAVADQNGFVVVYPNGTGPLKTNTLLTWNGGDCCGYAQQNDVDDVGFVRAIAADLQTHLNVDSRRIYAAGMSNGAIMSHRLACQAADLFAAIGPDSGTLNFSPCQPSRPVSVIEFHGTADQYIPYDGGYGSKSLVKASFASVPTTISFWTGADGCGSQPNADSFADIQHQTWTGCGGGSSVELYTIVNGGHAWPGGQSGGSVDPDQPTQTISASQLMWQFFAAHPMP